MKSQFKKPFFIYNPVAGAGDPEKAQQVFKQACVQYGWQPKIHETEESEDLAQVIWSSLEGGCDVIMAGGGDGTVSAVASALVNSNVPLAIIPMGTGNLLARQLDLPLQMEKAFEYIAEMPEILFVDAMRIDERHYVLNASVGLSSVLIENTSREDKHRFGFLAYILTGIREFLGLQPYLFDLVVDDSHYLLRASEIFVSDTALLKEEAFLADVNMRADDGQLEVFVIKARTGWDYFSLLIDILQGRSRSTYKMDYYPARKQVRISTKKPLTVQADGEVIRKTPVIIEVIPRAIRVLVPKTKPEASE